MALEEQRGAQRDGTARSERARAELEPGSIGIEERSQAELIGFARRFASQLLWYDLDNRPGGWWATPERDTDAALGSPDEPPRSGPTFFDGIGPSTLTGAEALSYAEAAAFAADPAAFPGERYAGLRRPHMALLLTAIRLMRHSQRALNELVERHLDHHLRDVLGLAPRPPEPDRAFVLFELGSGVHAAEAPTGLRLLAGRDARQRERIYRLERPLVVNRARVAKLASTFVDREVIRLADARRAITGTPDEQFLFMLGIPLGEPRPSDPLPLFRSAPLTMPRLAALGQIIAFAPQALFMELHELRALLARKARRSTEAEDWASINAILETAGRIKRGDPDWQLAPVNPKDFAANLAVALGGAPDLGGLTEVETVDDLALHLGRADVRDAIQTKLLMDVDRQFAPMMALKRSIEADWAVINNSLQQAGRRKRSGQPDWVLPVVDPADFATNFAIAVGPVDFGEAGPEAAGISDLDSYLARIAEAEAYFFMSAEELARLVATHGSDEGTPAGAAAWRAVYELLGKAHARKVRAAGAAELRAIRENPPAGRTGLAAGLEAVLRELPASEDGWMDALARYAEAEEVAVVRAALPSLGHGSEAPEWSRIDAILAEARRRRLRLPEPEARKEHWRALYAHADARVARVSSDGAAWRCFGGMPPDLGPGMTPVSIGWAIASPALALSTGRRQLTLTLGFQDDGAGPLIAPLDDRTDSPRKRPFTVTLSGAEGWSEPTSITFSEVSYSAVQGTAPLEAGTTLLGLQVGIIFDEAAPEIALLPEGDSFSGTPWPVLRLMLRAVWKPESGRFDTAYERFRGLKLTRVHLAAAVGGFVDAGAPGLWPLLVETETGPADGKRPFEPFGPAPARGSELALGHRDLLHKRLTRVALGFEWLGGPSDLSAHYALYAPRDFQAQLSLTDGAVRTTALAGPTPLFTDNDANLPVRIERPVGEASRIDPVVGALDPEVRSWRRYLTLRLVGSDFGHHDYPALATTKSIELANELRKGTNVSAVSFAVSPPYTPKLKRAALDFTAEHEIDVTRYDRSRAVDRIFHVHPFGIEEARATDAGWPLLPAYDEEGALYIGLADVEAPQSLSLLFASVQGSGDGGRPGTLAWSYLDAGGWTAFPEPPEDITSGFSRRDLVRFTLPATEGSPQMPPGLYWLRAAMGEGAANACDMLDVHAQAASARFVDDGAPSEHYLAPLPANSVRTVADSAPGIVRVVQPYPSEGGRGPESAPAFRARASERLRHKNRALTVWDYERLVLERFPAVHKAKCIPASLVGRGSGVVRIVVIPDIRGQTRTDPFTPRAPASLLDEIAAYLAGLVPPTVRVEVGHAAFLRVRVRVGVSFRRGGNETYNRRRLAESVSRYLAPWAFDEGGDITIGQRIEATSIVAFVDGLPYVDFVGTCRLFVSADDGETYQIGPDGGSWVETQREDAVLTPAPRHEIDVITDDRVIQDQFVGVGYMKVELDFVVG